MTGYEVAKDTGISRSNVYAALTALVEKGAAYLAEGEVTKYRPVELNIFTSNKISELKKNAEYLDITIQKNRYLKELSDEFFELTKIENSSEELHLEEVNLSNLLTETLLEQHSWIADRNILTEFDIADGIIIRADFHCLTRILNNLMSNAQKYSADSFGAALKKDGERVMLRVSNTLEDCTSLNIDRVFEPFYRMDARTAGGSGLGLYVVKLLCDRLGWSVKAKLNDNVFTATILI
jgi:signal transduction histidine kinase